MIKINVVITKTLNDMHLLELAIERNATHGLQLSQEDKRNMARKIYHITSEKERNEKKKKLSKILSVSERTIRDWLSRIDKDSKEARNKRIFEMWMACYTQEEIGEKENLDKAQINRICCEMAGLPKLNKSDKAAAEHAIDFQIPLYNVWKQQVKTKGINHFGNTEIRWVDNLLYLYTNPFDVVVDLFAGGGSTIDICKKRFRRYWVSDRLPIIEREQEIRKYDITNGLPSLSRWKDIKLVYLDPPYWKQAKGKYSNDADDLSNMSLQQFNETLSNFINSFAKKLNKAYIALVIRPSQLDGEIIDHIADMLKFVNLPIDMRYSVPYESQQCTAQEVDWAKKNKRCLILTREIIVWKI